MYNFNQNSWYGKFHYKVGNKIYKNDYQAMSAFSKDRKQSLEFVINAPRVWNQDWTVEPDEDLDQLYDNFSMQIAAKYDDIILGYTGGTDSHTILRSFVRCGIRNVRLCKSSSWAANSPQRKDEVSWITGGLSEFGNQLGQLGWSWINQDNHSGMAMTSFNKSKYIKYLEQFEHCDGSWTVNAINPTWDFAVTDVDKNKYLLPSTGKRSVCILGLEKPQLTIIDDWWHLQHVSTHTSLSQFQNDNTDIILFFMDNDAHKIHCKMAWCKLKTIENIVRREKYKYTGENWDWINTAAKHYVEICAGMNQFAIIPLLATSPFKRGNALGNAYMDWMKNYYDLGDMHDTMFQEILQYSIDDDLLNFDKKGPHGIYQKPIPIRPVSDDIVNNTHLVEQN
jgi:hypothetical protein